jgi:hypothetical protein
VIWEEGVGYRRNLTKGSTYATLLRGKDGTNAALRDWTDYRAAVYVKNSKPEYETEMLLAFKIQQATQVMFFRYLEMLGALVKLRSAKAADEVIDLFFRREANHLMAEVAKQVWTDRNKLHLNDVKVLNEHLTTMDILPKRWTRHPREFRQTPTPSYSSLTTKE